MKARLRSVFSHGTPRWEPPDIGPEDPGQRSNSDSRHTPSTNPKSEPNECTIFHIQAGPSNMPPISKESQLLKPRKSAISLTSVPDAKLLARTNYQWQSTFFAKLPLEVRRMVYGYLYESETIHLTIGEKKDRLGRRDTKFGNFICTHSQIGTCTCRVIVAGSALENSLPQLEIGQLGLIRSCRRMYSECIHYLYSTHSFAILHTAHLLALPKRIPQQRLDAIRVLRMRWTIRALPYLRRIGSHKLAYREDTENWEKGWDILGRMKGLKSLRVILVDPSAQGIWENNWLELEAAIMQPIKKLRIEGEFEITLPYASCDVERNMGVCAVRLRRPGEAVDQQP